MKSAIQNSLKSLASNVEYSVTFEKVWSQYTREEKAIRRSANRYLRRSVASIAIGALGLTGSALGLSFVSPSVALAMHKTPVVNQVYDWFGDPGLNRVAVFGNDVNIAYTDRGISFTVTNVYDDQGRVSLQYQISSSNGSLGTTPLAPDMTFYINGKPLDVTTGGAAGLISSKLWNGVNEIFPSSSLPEKFNLQIVMHRIGSTLGYWEVQVPVSSVQTPANTQVFSPNISKTSQGITLKIDQVTLTPASVLVDYEYTIERDQNVYLLLNASSGKQIMIPELSGPASKSFNGNMETVRGVALYDKPTNLGNTIEIHPENNPIPPKGAVVGQSIELPNLDIEVPLG